MNEVLPSNKKFGLFFGFLFAVLLMYFMFTKEILFGLLCGLVSTAFIVSAIFFPASLQVLNKLWFKLGVLLGLVVSPLVLGAIFYLLITPMALSMRLFNRDELNIRVADGESSWKIKDSEGLPPDSFKNQF
jgi:hypothetical protein